MKTTAHAWLSLRGQARPSSDNRLISDGLGPLTMTGMGGLRMGDGVPYVHGPETMGEVDIGLRAFWYRPMLLRNTIDVEVDIDWGIHCNADALAEQAAIMANRMNEDGIEELKCWPWT